MKNEEPIAAPTTGALLWALWASLVTFSVALSVFITLMVVKWVQVAAPEPRVWVLDSAALSMEILKRYPNDAALRDRRLTEAIERVRELQGTGSIVLDRRAVLTMPESAQIDIEGLLQALDDSTGEALARNQ